MTDALAALEDRVRADLNKTAHPDAAWLTPKLGPDDRPALDVLIVGAGQSGLATAFGLLRSQVSNILVLDKSEEGAFLIDYRERIAEAYQRMADGRVLLPFPRLFVVAVRA